jgi:hypothetical protein
MALAVPKYALPWATRTPPLTVGPPFNDRVPIGPGHDP